MDFMCIMWCIIATLACYELKDYINYIHVCEQSWEHCGAVVRALDS